MNEVNNENAYPTSHCTRLIYQLPERKQSEKGIVTKTVKKLCAVSGLHQVPEIAVQVFEYGYRSVRFFAGLPDELNAGFGKVTVIPPKVVSVQKQEHAAARLVAHAAGLLLIGGFGQQQFACTIARRRYHYPAFGLTHARVLHQNKPEFLRIKFNGPVVVVHYQRDLNNSLSQGFIFFICCLFETSYEL
jgi:hypothetical protein